LNELPQEINGDSKEKDLGESGKPVAEDFLVVGQPRLPSYSIFIVENVARLSPVFLGLVQGAVGADLAIAADVDFF